MYERGIGVRPVKYVVGELQPVLNPVPVGDTTQLEPPKPVRGVVEVPTHVARVTSVQEDEPGVLPVPEAQVMHVLDVVAVTPPREYVLEVHGLVIPEL